MMVWTQSNGEMNLPRPATTTVFRIKAALICIPIVSLI